MGLCAEFNQEDFKSLMSNDVNLDLECQGCSREREESGFSGIQIQGVFKLHAAHHETQVEKYEVVDTEEVSKQFRE